MIKYEKEYGNIYIATDVVAKIVGNAATSCFGVVGMALSDAADGIVSLLKKDRIEKGVKVTSTPEGLAIDIHIIVSYGYNLSAIAKSIENEVSYAIERELGTRPASCKVFIDSMRVE
ncbi:MAG: Asp23/Gls24 family envelope stress response protein [Ruminococcaceae bacterium]|nr:Asp23/Gls24 family envelope stress response protein [Oscillospiraceae bacterium]